MHMVGQAVCTKEISIHNIPNNKIDIRQQLWAISADSKMAALTKPDQPTATRKHDTEEDTREAHGRHIKQAAKAPPTTKLRF